MIFFILILFFSTVAMAKDCVEKGKQKPSNWKALGKELVVVNGKKIELNVRKNEHDIDFRTGEKVVTFIKENDTVTIDSSIFSDGTSFVEESDFSTEGILIQRNKWRTGLVVYSIMKGDEITEIYEIGHKKEELYDSDGKLNPEYREIRGDTAFLDLDYRAPGCGFGLTDDIKGMEEITAKRRKK